MITITVINSDDAPDRLVSMWAEADRLGLSMRRQKGDGPATLADHRAAWRHIVESDDPCGVVMSDRTAPDDGLVALLQPNFLDLLLARHDLVLLDVEDRDDEAEVQTVRPLRRAVPETAAYIMSRKAAVAALESGTADTLHGVLNGLRSQGVAPAFVSPPILSAQSPMDERKDDGLALRPRRALGRRLRAMRSRGGEIVVPRTPTRQAQPEESISA